MLEAFAALPERVLIPVLSTESGSCSAHDSNRYTVILFLIAKQRLRGLLEPHMQPLLAALCGYACQSPVLQSYAKARNPNGAIDADPLRQMNARWVVQAIDSLLMQSSSARDTLIAAASHRLTGSAAPYVHDFIAICIHALLGTMEQFTTAPPQAAAHSAATATDSDRVMRHRIDQFLRGISQRRDGSAYYEDSSCNWLAYTPVESMCLGLPIGADATADTAACAASLIAAKLLSLLLRIADLQGVIHPHDAAQNTADADQSASPRVDMQFLYMQCTRVVTFIK